MKTSLVDYEVSQEMRFAGPSVFDTSKPSVAIGEVYETDGDLSEWWFAWVRPPEGIYMSARAHSKKAVLAKLSERSRLALRTMRM